MGYNDYWVQFNNDNNNSSQPSGTSDGENEVSKSSSKDVNIFADGTKDYSKSSNNKPSSIFNSKSKRIDDFQSNINLTTQQVQEEVITVIANNAEVARQMLMKQNNGAVSNLYNKYKEWKDDDLSLSNVEEAVVLQQECADNLQKAKDGILSKREYFLQNREHLKTMMKRRLFRKDENTGLDFLDRNRGKLTKKEFEKIMEDYINSEIDKIDKLDSLKKLQQMLVITTNSNLEQMLLNYKKKAEEVKHNPLVEQRFTIDNKLKIPVEYDTTEPITFEEVFKFERNQEYSKEKVIDYIGQEDKRLYAINAYQRYQQSLNNIDLYIDLYTNIITNAGIDVNTYSLIYKETVTDLTENIFGDSNFEGKIKFISEKMQTLHNKAFGDDYATDLVKAMEQDNQTIIDRTTGITQATGLGLTVVGGVLCFTPAAAVGAGLVTLGNTLSIGGLAAENVLGYTEALTRQHVDSKEIEELNNSLLMDTGGFLIGVAAGQVGMKAFNKLIDVKLAEVFKVQTFKGNRTEALKQVFTNPENLKNFMQAAGVKISADFLISYAGDLAMSEALGTDDDWISLLKANLIGIAASTSGDISNVAHLSMKGEKYRELKQQVQNRSQEYRESLNETFANVDSKYKDSTEKYQQVIDKAVKCYEEFGVKIEFKDVNGEYGATITEIYKELNNFSKINGLDIPNKIILKKGEKTEVYWDKNTNEVTYIIGNDLKSNDVRYSLRHEFVHGSDTKPELGDTFPKSFKNENVDVYIKEMLKAGLTPDEIVYALQNRKEFISVASQGNVNAYSKEMKQLLKDCGLPEEILKMQLADPHSRKVNYSDDEINNIAKQIVGKIEQKPSEDRLHAWVNRNSNNNPDKVAQSFQYDTHNEPKPLDGLFDRGSYNPITRQSRIGTYNFNSSALVEATGGKPLIEEQVTISSSGARRGKNKQEQKTIVNVEHPEYTALVDINGETVEITYYGYNNDNGSSIYRIKQVKRGNLTCTFNLQRDIKIDNSEKTANTKVKNPKMDELDKLNKEFIIAATGICYDNSGYNGIKMLDRTKAITVNGQRCAINGNVSGRNINKSYDVDYELKLLENSNFGNSRWFGKSKEIQDKDGNITGYEINFDIYSYDSHSGLR